MQNLTILKKLKKFEIHHKIIFFIIFFYGTIIFLRITTLFYNPTPILFNFEFHHFDYGLIILIIMNLLLLFNLNKNKQLIYLPISAIGLGLIIDQFWFIRNLIQDPTPSMEMTLYHQTIIPTQIFIILIIIFILYNNIKK